MLFKFTILSLMMPVLIPAEGTAVDQTGVLFTSSVPVLMFTMTWYNLVGQLKSEPEPELCKALTTYWY